MDFKFHIGTKVFFGKDCLENNKGELGRYGKKALIVCGRTSARRSGALEVVEKIFGELGIAYETFDRVENNPSLENVKEGGNAAKSFGADFIIGIGGGSPLDAAKAVAVLAVNDIEPIELYKNVFTNRPLPIICIPTTSGTGSEVTPYSILTRKDMETKMSFGNEDTFPRASFLDAAYTESMNYETTVNTAVDALSHAVEGYISRRSTTVSDILAVDSIKAFGECIEALLKGNMDFNIREKLLYASMLGGMVIAHTGTTIVHGMGYSLTFFKDIPHGKANGLLMAEYFKYNYQEAGEKIKNIIKLLGLKDIEEFGALMDKLLPDPGTYTREELEKYAELAMKQRSTTYNIRAVVKEDLVHIMTRSLIG